MTQATLQEWALSQGMDANIATMTQAEKVLLRYNYVMAQTAMAQGDFQRTQNTWANQIRILKQQFEALGAVIGQNFVYAIKPIVQALNVVMAKLIQFANVVSASLGKIFGWKFEDTTGGIVNDLEFGADAAEDLGGGLGGAADKAKKLRQQLQGFDELNVLTTNQGSSGGGGGGGGFDNEITSTNAGQWVKDTEESLFESDLDSLYKLGDYIGTTLTNQLRSIRWEEVYEGARNFGTGLANFLNGLISPELFSATGSTIAGALNTAIYSTLAFGTEFDFEELGLSIAEGINSFFRDTDFVALAQDINVWVDGIWTTITTAVGNIDWVELFSSFYDYITGLDVDTVIKLIGLSTLANLIKSGLFSSIAGILSGKTLIDKIVSILGTSAGNIVIGGGLANNINNLGTAIFSKFNIALSTAFLGFNFGNWIYEKFSDEIDYGVEKIGNYFGLGGGTTPDTDWETYYKQGLNKFNNATQAQSYADYVIGYIEKGWNERQAPNIAEERLNIELHNAGATGWENYSLNVENATNANKRYSKSQAKVEKATNKSSKSVDAFAKFAFSHTVNLDKVNEKSDSVAKNQALFGATMLGTYNQLSEDAEIMSADVVRSYDNMDAGSSGRMNNMRVNILGNANILNTNMSQKMQTMATNTITQFTNMFNGGSDNVAKLKNSSISNISSMASSVISNISGMASDTNTRLKMFSTNTTNSFATAKKDAVSQVDSMSSIVVGKLSTMKNNGITATNGLNTNLRGKFEDARLGANASFVGMHNTVVSYMNASSNYVAGQSWYSTGTNLVAGLSNGIYNSWSGGLINTVKSLAQSLTNKLKSVFGVHSPSRVWRDDVGYWLAEGLRIGIVDEESNLIGSVVGMGERLTNSLNDSLTIATPSLLSGNYDLGVTSTMAHSYSADSSMSSSVADGVRQGLSASQMEQNALLREQNELLYQILQKESISSDDVYNVVVNKNRDTFNRTGTNPLFA